MTTFSNLYYRSGARSLALRFVAPAVTVKVSAFSNVPRDDENAANQERLRLRDRCTSYPGFCRLLVLSLALAIPNLFNYWGGKRLSQLLALFVAIAVTPSMVLAEDEDHLNGRDKVHDPTGAWLIRNDAEGSPFILSVFHKGGTFTGDTQGEGTFDPAATKPPFNVIESPENGVWQKTGWNTFAVTFLTMEYQVQVNPLSAPLFQFDKVQLTGVLNESGDRIELTAAISFYDSSGNQIGDTIQVPTKGHGVRIPLEILPNTSHTLPIPQPPQ